MVHIPKESFNPLYLLNSINEVQLNELALCFRAMECQMIQEIVTKLCSKFGRIVTEWDKVKIIPLECKRIMSMMRAECNGRLELPTGKIVSPQLIFAGIALLHIKAELDIKTVKQLIDLARSIARI